MKIVTIGGGTGQRGILEALVRLKKEVAYPIEITAIPATTDNGGSSGVLSHEQDIFAVGDISQCALGLHANPLVAEPLFGERRHRGGSLEGHTTRNIISLSYFKYHGYTQKAMDEMRNAFALEGRITPVTFTQTTLCARLKDGTLLEGENAISRENLLAHGGLEELWLDQPAQANEAALLAIRGADVVIICPGTLISSIAPNFLVDGVTEALRASRGLKVLVTNLMNRLGHEPDEWSVLDHVDFIERYAGERILDVILSNTQALTPEQVSHYKEEKIAVPLRIEDQRARGRSVIGVPLLMNGKPKKQEGDVLADSRSLVRHDPKKLAHALRTIVELQGTEKQAPWLLLDFDRTMFDTDSFASEYGNAITAHMHGRAFADKELTRYVYADVMPLLKWARENQIRTAIVTYTSGHSEFQRNKIAAADILPYVDACIYVEKGGLKGKAVADTLGSDIAGVCVDDFAEVSESLGAHCPNVTFRQIDRRHGALGDITTLEAVRTLLKP